MPKQFSVALLPFGMLGALLCAGCETTPPGTSGTATPATPSRTEPNSLAAQTLPGSAVVLGETQAALDGASLTTVNVISHREVWIRARVPNVDGLASVKVLFVNPKLEHFYDRTFMFSADPKQRVLMGPNDNEIDLLHPTQLPLGYALDVSVPIGGSEFERHGTAGFWTLNLEVDRGASKPKYQLSTIFELALDPPAPAAQ